MKKKLRNLKSSSKQLLMKFNNRLAFFAILLSFLFVDIPLFAQVDYAPNVPQPSQNGDIVGLVLQNTTAATEAAGYVTFGEVFKQGSVQKTDHIVARIAGINYPAQMDVKATNCDSSVRHAIITLKAPSIAANSSIGIMLALGKDIYTAPFAPSPSALLTAGYNLTTNFTFRDTSGSVIGTDAASAAATLQNAGNNPPAWLSGPIVNEWRVQTTVFNTLLKVTFDIRAYQDGTTHTDVIYDNSWLASTGKKWLIYDVAISQNSSQLFSFPKVNHYLYSKWHHEVNSAGIVTPNIQYDIPYLEATGAIMNFDISTGASDAQIQNYYNMNNSNTGILGTYNGISGMNNPANSTSPMGTCGIDTHMPDVGGRAESDWGPQPGWVALWLVSQNELADTVMIENNDASGGIPWHFTDETTGEVINPDTYPNFEPNAPAPLQYGWPSTYYVGWQLSPDGDPWHPDFAHMPDMTYVPYLITGSHYRLDLFLAQCSQAIYITFNRWEKDASGTVTMGVAAPSQVRDMAWKLRHVTEAAFLDPDNDGLKTMFVNELGIAMTAYVQEYITDNINGQFGQMNGMTGVYSTENNNWGDCCSFEDDASVDMFAEIAGMNMPAASSQAVQMLHYKDPFTSGRFTNTANGFNPYFGASYHWGLFNAPTMTNNTGGSTQFNNTAVPITTWKELAQSICCNNPNWYGAGRPASIQDSLVPGTNGSVTNSDGIWTFDSLQAPWDIGNNHAHWVLLNGITTNLQTGYKIVISGGYAYVLGDDSASWVRWGNGWNALNLFADPSYIQSLPSADTIMSGSGGSLTTAAGTWTFGALNPNGPNPNFPPMRLVLLNGQPVGTGFELALVSGTMYLKYQAQYGAGYFDWAVWSTTGPSSFHWCDNINGSGPNCGYSFCAQSALANLVTYTGSSQSQQAYNWIVPANQNDFGGAAGVTTGFQSYPQWNIISRTPSPIGCSNTTAVPPDAANKNNTLNVDVYPNPTSGVFTIVAPSLKGENNSIEIYNLLGEKIFAEEINKSTLQGGGQIALPSGLGQGIYFLQIKTGQGVAIKKLIISK